MLVFTRAFAILALHLNFEETNNQHSHAQVSPKNANILPEEDQLQTTIELKSIIFSLKKTKTCRMLLFKKRKMIYVCWNSVVLFLFTY